MYEKLSFVLENWCVHLLVAEGESGHDSVSGGFEGYISFAFSISHQKHFGKKKLAISLYFIFIESLGCI